LLGAPAERECIGLGRLLTKPVCAVEGLDALAARLLCTVRISLGRGACMLTATGAANAVAASAAKHRLMAIFMILTLMSIAMCMSRFLVLVSRT